MGHFTQMVREPGDRVVCAISQFRASGHVNTYLALTNKYLSSICEPGQAASTLKGGPYPKYSTLCSGK